MKAITINYASEPTRRGRFALWMLEKLTPLHTWLCRDREPWGLSVQALSSHPPGSLGAALAAFYRQEGFEPIPRAEKHDVYHVLLDYGTHMKDESSMQFFLWGNGKPSVFTLGTAWVSWILFPEYFGAFRAAYRKGKAARSLRHWDLQSMLGEDLDQLRQRLFSPEQAAAEG